MLEIIIELINETDATTEELQIAKGRNEYPKTFTELFKKIKLGAWQ